MISAAAIAIAGCGSGGSGATRPTSAEGVFGSASRGGGGSTAGGGWSIVLAATRGPDRDAAAASLLERASRMGVEGAFLDRRGESTVVAVGSFPSATDPRAQAELARLRALEWPTPGGGVERPFAGVVLAPPEGVAGSVPDWDLRNARQLHGDGAVMTLQIGVYGRVDGAPTRDELAAARSAAEAAVASLRREGEMAFYFHGAQRSTVTVGLFEERDADAELGESAEVRRLRARFPHNLVNGAGVRERSTQRLPDGTRARVERMQQSLLVRVP